LFLFNHYLKEAKDYSRNDFPKRLVSVTVDHDLQASSSEMAKHAANVANSLGVDHITEKLPWGRHGLPSKPGPGDKIEGIARMMRYKAIFEQLKSLQSDAVALGHHLDDQVETMLMRLGRGATTYGLAAMRPCRRWGMGGKSQEAYGLEGLSKWIARPLLSFGKVSETQYTLRILLLIIIVKDRILATCKENKLSYVKDPTNFQPEITLRNAIRHKIRGNSTPWGHTSEEEQFSQELVQGLKGIRDAAEEAKLNISLETPLDRLRQESNHISAIVQEQEAQGKCLLNSALRFKTFYRVVDEIIAKCRLPSPPGTFMISAGDLDRAICPDIKDLLLFRITRYVSPEAWGNPRAELGRRKSSVERLRQRISAANKADGSICVGSHVWWRPLYVTKHRVRPAWLAQRQPPSVTSIANFSSFEMDKELFNRQRDKRVDMKILFDKRFVIHIDPENIPQNIVGALSLGYKVVVEPSKQWFLPEIILRGGNADEPVHTHVIWPYDWRKTFRYRREEVVSGWATIDYIRPISAI
jgi:tRNA(Ile)-lysidine synthetase-like protein